MRIIPAIDLLDGNCVRLIQGDYDQSKVYDQNPVDVAIGFEKRGFEHLHLVDLDGAKNQEPQNLIVLNTIALQTKLKVDFGGGIKSENALISALSAGAHQVNVGSLAVRNPALVKFWIKKYGRDKIIISADSKEGKIAIGGWQKSSERDLFEFINEYIDFGAKYFVCTDIAKDGMMMGSSTNMYREIIKNFPEIKLIASGGVTSFQEIHELRDMGCDGAIIGKAIYEGLIDLRELQEVVSLW